MSVILSFYELSDCPQNHLTFLYDIGKNDISRRTIPVLTKKIDSNIFDLKPSQSLTPVLGLLTDKHNELKTNYHFT